MLNATLENLATLDNTALIELEIRIFTDCDHLSQNLKELSRDIDFIREAKKVALQARDDCSNYDGAEIRLSSSPFKELRGNLLKDRQLLATSYAEAAAAFDKIAATPEARGEFGKSPTQIMSYGVAFIFAMGPIWYGLAPGSHLLDGLIEFVFAAVGAAIPIAVAACKSEQFLAQLASKQRPRQKAQEAYDRNENRISFLDKIMVASGKTPLIGLLHADRPPAKNTAITATHIAA